MRVPWGLRRSGLARAGLIALLVLAYLVYTVGRLLDYGLDRLPTDPPVRLVVVPTLLLAVVLVLVDRFFRPAGSGGDAE